MFSDELEKINWEETTKAIYSKTEADVLRALGKSHWRRRRLYGTDFTRRREISRTNGTPESQIHRRTIRQNYFNVYSSVYYQFMYKLMRVLRISYQ